MLKLFLVILKHFPKGRALLNEHFAAERAMLEMGLEESERNAEKWCCEMEYYAGLADTFSRENAECNAEIVGLRLQLDAATAADSESVFNASLASGSVYAPSSERDTSRLHEAGSRKIVSG